MTAVRNRILRLERQEWVAPDAAVRPINVS